MKIKNRAFSEKAQTLYLIQIAGKELQKNKKFTREKHHKKL